MPKPTPHTLFLAFGMFLACIATGTLITFKLTTSNTAISYLWFTSFISIIGFSLLLKKYKGGQENLSDQLLYFCSYGFCLVWFLLSLFMPIFWMQNIDLTAKIILGFFSIAVFSANFFLGFNEIKKQWITTGSTAFEQEFKKYGASVDWENVGKKMKINFVIHIPGIPKRFMDIISILLIGFMIIGLNLRTAMPIFSAFAWGIPATVFAGCLIQVMGSYLFLVRTVRDIEKKKSVTLRAAGKN